MLKMNSDLALLAPRVSFSAFMPIRLENIHLAFARREIFSNLNLEIGAQGITAIMGPNGAGKSLILRLLAGLIEAAQGRVLYNGKPEVPHGQIGFVFQRPVLLRRSVQDNVMHALAVAGVARAERPFRTQGLLELGGMEHLAKSPARKLSGGEQQRLTLLRALACNPGLLLLDEPSASLDPQATALIENIVLRASQCGVKVIIVTHDQGQAARVADEVAFVHKGQVLDIESTESFLNNPQSRLAKAYLAGALLID
ncbi:ATP-binding cassette domain-containing protein [Limnobacter sp.]|uniref:ATP-binding cassette domain-containing protein n=1 Tax=Limnobacter sp. TaxID=2003368 RepID=UPI0027326330|nr:ATP-binding cassette domain-containing protein [Limnobacter sp.]MDP3189774.1 ATP-binding cassette domain-containing protein [Limnobacter sp.]